jgi:hypothetical protein
MPLGCAIANGYLIFFLSNLRVYRDPPCSSAHANKHLRHPVQTERRVARGLTLLHQPWLQQRQALQLPQEGRQAHGEAPGGAAQVASGIQSSCSSGGGGHDRQRTTSSGADDLMNMMNHKNKNR